MKQYQKYKDSGMRWINDIPENWEVRKFKYLFKERSQKGFPDLPMLAATQTKGVVPKEKYESRTVIAQKDLHLLKLVEEGDFVISLRSFQGGIEYAYYRGIISPAYTVLIPDEQIASSYFKYLAKSQPFIGLLKTCVTGIREGQNINYDIFRIASIPLPSKSEQTKIGKYLDNKMLRINKFIRNKRRLIQLLKEQKQAIINQAITRGINPDVKMKPSGVDWLGDIPKEWKVKRFKNACRLQRGYDLSNDKFVEGTIPVYGSNGIIGYHNACTTNAPCITVGRSGSVGEVNFVDQDFWAHNTTLFVIENYQNDWKYLYYLLLNIDLKMVSGGSAVPTLNRNYIHQMYVAIPTHAEQQRIVLHIESQIRKINVIAARTEREIELIQEYRTRLISDVVTGKVDVRDIKVEDIEVDELTEDMPNIEEFEDSIGDGKEV